MRKQKYITDPKEIYTLELEKLQRCFSEVTKIGETASEVSRVTWKQVECLRHMNFMLEGAKDAGERIVGTKINKG